MTKSSDYRLLKVLCGLLMGGVITMVGVITPMLAKDASSEATINVILPPDVPPAVPFPLTIDPLSNTHTALLTTTVSISYDEPISPATVSTQTFAVHARQTGLITQTYTVNGGTITLTPPHPFKPGELVQVSATTRTLNLSGQEPISATVWQFKTAVQSGSGVFVDSGQSLGNQSSWAVALGDLNGDGYLDAFVGNSSAQPGNRVWLNNGDGVFSDSGQSLGDSRTHAIALGDLDSDGDLDAFVANTKGQPNRVWLNNGTGIFTNTGQALGNSYSSHVALGDLDGDGDLDAFVSNTNAQSNQVWLNNGAGVFTNNGQSLGNSYSSGVDLGDLDGDGDLDAFVTNGSGVNQPNKVWLNNGAGVFTDSGQNLSQVSSRDVALGDLDNDGDLDAFVANGRVSGEAHKVWLNDSAGNFTDSNQRLGDADSNAVDLGDIDGDGDLDAFIGNSNDTSGYPNKTWLNDGHGNFTDGDQNLGDSRSIGVALGDVDNDGDLDAIVANIGSENNGNKVWLNQNLLLIGKVGPDTANINDLITYTLTVTNNTNITVTNLTITDVIPAGANYISGGTEVGNVVSWTATSLAADTSMSVQFVVTAAQTVVNYDYHIGADDGHYTSGSEAVVTTIGAGVCPTTPNSVCVLDDSGLPVSGALIYRNGQLVADINGNPILTNEQGFLILTGLNVGETLAALQPVYQQPTNKSAHNPDSSSSFAFRIHRTSMPVDNSGNVTPYIVPGSSQAHTLVVQPHNALVLFNIVVSVEWDATNEYIDQLKVGLEKASNMLYDATDGQMAFGWVTIYDNGDHWRNADIQVRTHNHTWPHAYIGGISPSGPQRLIYKGINPDPGQIVLGRYWDGYGAGTGSWHQYDGYATIAHEFGHYGLFLFDEYFYYTGNSNYRVRQSSRCSVNTTDPASIMYFQYEKSEFCSRPEHYPEYHGGAPTRQTQVYGPNETSWITIQGVYSDALQAMSSGSPPWVILSPPDRGVDFVLGPSQPPLDKLLGVDDKSRSTGAFTRKPVTVKYDGDPIWGALVSLHRSNGPVIDQGLTDRQGNIEILGAAVGDVIRVRTPSNSLAGSLSILNAGQQEIGLSPVFGGQSGGLSTQNSITNSTPLITIIPRTDGTTIDYFMENTGELSNTVYANIQGAQSPPLNAKTMSYNGSQAQYFVDFTGYSTGTLTGLTFQMTTTVGSSFIEVGTGHNRAHTDDAQDTLNLTSTDGNMVLNAPGQSFASSIYVVANATNALPGSPAAGKVIIGESYSIQASGGLSGSQKAMALTLNYQTGSLGDVDENTIQPYYWDAFSTQWQPLVSYTLNITNNQVSSSVDLFGIYILMGDLPGPSVSSVTPSLGDNQSMTAVVVKGNNFEDGAKVRLGMVVTLTVTYVDAETLLASIPAGLIPDTYDVTVINPNGQEGTLTYGFTVSGDVQKAYLPIILKQN